MPKIPSLLATPKRKKPSLRIETASNDCLPYENLYILRYIVVFDDANIGRKFKRLNTLRKWKLVFAILSTWSQLNCFYNPTIQPQMITIHKQDSPTFALMDKLASVHMLIQSGQIRTLADLYKRVPRKDVGELLQNNPVAFTRRAMDAGKFRLEEIKLLAEKMDVPFEELLQVFVASM